ncbi:sialidase family protein [Gordoniibacillus kamchatkensis]|uniref:sialidase family protein n=1 Tax=Gordoniibacillus kamchatkensis TaxID=1590651 RepID=UPI0006979B88|nr:sialidase family protein [Paenibacillus sp. VKM B-2647]
MNKSEAIALFSPGLAGSAAYRIPSMITTVNGTIIAGIDARISDMRDNPNKINTVIRRSADNGLTWSDVQQLVAYPGEGLDGAAAIDTALLQDEQTGTIWMLFSHTPGGIGLWSAEEGTGFDAKGNRLLYDSFGGVYSLQPDGRVTDGEGRATPYMVDGEGNVTIEGNSKGNIFLKKGAHPEESLLEARTSFLQIIKSDDDGRTWSKPIELNPMVKEAWMKFIGAGPGRGIQLKHGAFRGRLAFPIYFSNRSGKMSCAVIYSDDHGATWRRGASPNDGRIFGGQTVDAESLQADGGDLTESQLIELPDGELRVYMRNHAGLQRTAVAASKDGGQTWGEVEYDQELIDPVCQSSVIVYPHMDDGKTRVLFANPADPEKRVNGTVRLSEDGGRTWKYAKQIYDGPFSYCCLTVLSDGGIALLYECDFSFSENKPITVEFTKFSLEWLMSG